MYLVKHAFQTGSNYFSLHRHFKQNKGERELEKKGIFYVTASSLRNVYKTIKNLQKWLCVTAPGQTFREYWTGNGSIALVNFSY